MQHNVKRQGFTLVEMAIVLVIVGVVLVALVPPLMNMVKMNKQREGKTALTSIKDQIIGYAMDHGQLPPIDPNSGLTAGKPLNTAFGNPIDVWRQSFRYIPNPAICESNDQAVDICDASTDSGNTNYMGGNVLRVLDANGNTIDFVAFVVSSDGHDQERDLPDMTLPTGGAADSPWSLSVPVAGWSHDVDLAPVMPAGQVNDDIVEFVTLLELKAIMCSDSSAGGGGTTPPEHSAHNPWEEVRGDPTDDPGALHGDNDPSTEGYDGVYYTDEYGNEYWLGQNATDNTLATVINANWVAEGSYNMEVTARPSEGSLEDGSLPMIWDSGDLQIPGRDYLRNRKGVAIGYDFSYNVLGADLVSFTMSDPDSGLYLNLNGTIPSVPSGAIRLVGNFWVIAKAHSNSQQVEIYIDDINNYELPGVNPITDPFQSGNRLHSYYSQRDEAETDFRIQGEVMVSWQGNSYPNSDELGMQIGFELHDLVIP